MPVTPVNHILSDLLAAHSSCPVSRLSFLICNFFAWRYFYGFSFGALGLSVYDLRAIFTLWRIDTLILVS